MAEYLTQDVDLQTIANAIREKAGTSDALAFPAGFAEAIAAIESGGAKIAQGTFTPTEALDTYTVQHNLGVKPKIIFYGLSTTDNSGISGATSPTYRAVLYCEHWTDASVLIVSKTSSVKVQRTTVYPASNPCYVSNITETAVIIGYSMANSSYFSFDAGKEYIWFAVG